jgi:hypothetical protein
MSANASGSYRTTREAMMASYDRLPRTVRNALANAVENWVPQPLETEWKTGRYKPSDLAKMVAKWNRNETMVHRAKMVRLMKNGTNYQSTIRMKTVAELSKQFGDTP